MGADTKANARGGALQRGHGAPLEALAQLGDELCSVDTRSAAIIDLKEAAERIISQAASEWLSVNGH